MASSASQPIEAEFEGVLPAKEITALDDSRLLATGNDLSGHLSEDAGRTWISPFPYLQDSKLIKGDPHSAGGMIRLNNGDLGLAYCVEEDRKGASYNAQTWYFASSGDEGHNWRGGEPIDLPAIKELLAQLQHMWGNLAQLSTGRIIAPVYWCMKGGHPAMPPYGGDPVTATIAGNQLTRVADGHMYEACMGGCYAYYSDDIGKSWTKSTGSIMVWPLPGEDNVGGFAGTFEPVVAELNDGRVLMFMRTGVGRIFQSFSEDGGDHWSMAEPTELASGDVPCWLGRVPSTGDLLVIWNQSSAEEIENGYSRGRVSVATSSDEAKSWHNFKTVTMSPGMQPADRVEIPPIRPVRAKKNLGVLPDDFTRSDYPRLAFVHGKVLLIYSVVTYQDGERAGQTWVKVVPEERLYS